ncbi:alanine-glyoxylate aminotransferase [Megachile rotundata]|uniref:alanine-glyoxylate aminotransferase n=1 Tax=Megachile rotundata TaxID=143995 RepID=UPI000258DABA|nr:PREDICTED: serine--pyruvate aminotransferase, mitochondrial [Megachile rotundata]XP_012138081.1 PREDICTED: serine--pyruvate aminotransferase, mitochondrial [Megachile rotundata]XP_012138082.1 PREDICTED: serine--pyruvate aminotransferase, mitochondrial [Megachile rotundata]XP_012138083.1 PREDICTED: serine--pyruvate aminotransferase, mitochondrial [Megachile rotundata]
MNYKWDQLAVRKEPPKALRSKLQVPVKTLATPGPTNCSKRVLRSLQNQIIGHLQPEICQIMDEIKAGLQYVFQTNNRLTLALSASGHGGMEACLVNILEPGETVLIVKSGIWGERASDMATRIGANVELIETPHNKGLTLDELEVALAKYRPVAVFMVQAESSTGLKQPLEGFGDLVHKYDALFIVDCVASLGGEPFFMDSWNIDVTYTASQKVLGAPPGFAPISFSPRAERKLFQRKTKPVSFYWDLRILGVYWKCFDNEDRVYHHTMSATLLYGLREALAELIEEGLPASWARHAAAAARFRKGLELRGLRCYVQIPQYQLSTVISIELPPGVDERIIVQRALEKYKVEISRGLGPTVGKIIRIGFLGINASPKVVDLVLRVLDEGLIHAKKSKL